MLQNTKMDREGTSQASQQEHEAQSSSGSSHEHCILHDITRTDVGNFLLLEDVRPNAATQIEKIVNAKHLRLSQDKPNWRMEDVCSRIPEPNDIDTNIHGYHRECYRHFFTNIKRLEQKPSTSGSVRKSSRSGSADDTLFTQDCIFCNETKAKRVKVKGSWTYQKLSNFNILFSE